LLNAATLGIHNNCCEVATGQVSPAVKNRLHIASEQAGPKVAAIASIWELCHRLDINLPEHLKEMLPRLADWPPSASRS
jgi:hypothetical protein